MIAAGADPAVVDQMIELLSRMSREELKVASLRVKFKMMQLVMEQTDDEELPSGDDLAAEIERFLRDQS